MVYYTHHNMARENNNKGIAKVFIVIGIVLIILVIVVVLFSLGSDPEQDGGTAQKTDENTEILLNKETDKGDTVVIDNIAGNNEVIIPEQDGQPDRIEEEAEETAEPAEENRRNTTEESRNNIFRGNRANPFTEDRSDIFPNIILPSARPANPLTIQ